MKRAVCCAAVAAVLAAGCGSNDPVVLDGTVTSSAKPGKAEANPCKHEIGTIDNIDQPVATSTGTLNQRETRPDGILFATQGGSVVLRVNRLTARNTEITNEGKGSIMLQDSNGECHTLNAGETRRFVPPKVIVYVVDFSKRT